MRAGLFDRAENLFNELDEMKSHQEPALQNLLIIYQQEKDWEKCLQVASRLGGRFPGRSLKLERAHYYCELAEEAELSGDRAQTMHYLKMHRHVMRIVCVPPRSKESWRSVTEPALAL